jgi:hypothetical protein
MDSFFLWLGIAFVSPVLAYLVYEDWTLFSRPHKRTRGVVFDHHKSYSDGSDSYSPKVRFETEDGRRIEVTDNYGTPSARPQVGSMLEVIYPIEAPERARVRRPYLRVFMYCVLLLMLGLLMGRVLGLVR